MKSRRQIYIIVIVWAGVHACLFYLYGVRDQFVDSQRYIDMAKYLAEHGALESSYQIFYAVPISLLAVCQIFFTNSSVAYVVIQSLFSLLAALCLYYAGNKTFDKSGAGLFSALIFLIWLDCIQWNTALMTESLASTFICLVIYSLASFKGTIRDFIRLAFLLMLCVLTRPTGVIVVVSIVVFLMRYYHDDLGVRPKLKSVIMFLIASASVAGAYAMLNEWDFTDQYVKGNVVTYMDVLKGQPHYHESLRLDTTQLELPDTDLPAAQKVVLFAIENPLHFLKAATLKVFYVIAFYRPYFSTTHNVYTFLWLAIIYTCAYAGFRKLGRHPVRNFCLAVIVLNCLLVAVSAADWDNRFYLPMQPAITLLAGGGLAYMLTWGPRHRG